MTSLLHNRQTYSHIVGRFQVLPFRVAQILFFDVSEQLRVEGSKVAGDKRISPVFILVDNFEGVGPRVADCSSDTQEVSVDEPCVGHSEEGVVQFEDLPADEFIISIDNNKNVIRFAELEGCPSQVMHGPHLLLVPYDSVAFGRDLSLFLEVLLNLNSSLISGSIIDEDNMVVGVLLLQDGFDVLDVPVVFDVVVGGYHDAERQLLELAYRVFSLVVLSFLVCEEIVGVVEVFEVDPADGLRLLCDCYSGDDLGRGWFWRSLLLLLLIFFMV